MTTRRPRPKPGATASRPTTGNEVGSHPPLPPNPIPLGPPSTAAREPGLFAEAIPRRHEDDFSIAESITFRTSALPLPPPRLDLRPRLVDSAAGHIDVLLLTVPSDPHGGNAVHFETLIRCLGTETTFVVLHNEDNRKTVESWRPAAHPDARWLPISTPFTLDIWAQDPYVALEAVTGDNAEALTLLVEGVQFRPTGMIVADEVVAGLGLVGSPRLRALQSFLFFEGGNVLATPSRVLIGKDHPSRNLARPGLADEPAVSERFEHLFGAGRQGLLVVGTRCLIDKDDFWGRPDTGLTGWYQPVFHIDMHVTPTGRIGESGKEVLLYGTPRAAEKLAEIPGDFHLQWAFDEIEEQLEQHFEIVRLPILPRFGDVGQGWPEKHYYLTWNNVLIESFDNAEGGVSREVFMPTYGSPGDEVSRALDDEAERIWTTAGYRVHRLSNMEDLAWAGGSAHCITKTLRRGPAPQRQ